MYSIITSKLLLLLSYSLVTSCKRKNHLIVCMYIDLWVRSSPWLWQISFLIIITITLTGATMYTQAAVAAIIIVCGHNTVIIATDMAALAKATMVMHAIDALLIVICKGGTRIRAGWLCITWQCREQQECAHSNNDKVLHDNRNIRFFLK